MSDTGHLAISLQNPLEVILRFVAPVSAPRAAASANALTNAQLAMLGHGFFAMHNLQLDKALLARFLHLISGKKYSNVHNSDVHRKLLQLPKEVTHCELHRIQALCQGYDLPELYAFLAQGCKA